MLESGGARRTGWRLVLTVVIIAFGIRLPAVLHDHAIDDENVYAVVAAEMQSGGLPYVDAVERKPPLLFWTYEQLMRASGGTNWRLFHLFGVLWTLVTITGVYVVGRTLFDERAGFAAAFLVALFGNWAYWKNLALNGEMLMNLPVVFATVIVVRRTSTRIRWDLIAAGALLAIGFLLKQPAAIAAIPLGIYVLLPGNRRARDLRPGYSVLHAGLFSLGFFGVLGLVILQLARLGILSEALYWTIGDHDVPHGPTDPVFWIRGGRTTLLFVATCAPLVLPAVWSMRDGLRRSPLLWGGRPAEFTLLALLAVCSAMGVSASGRFYPHYFIQLVPPLALLAAPVAARWVPPARLVHHGEKLLYPWLAVTAIGFTLSYMIGLPSATPDARAVEYLHRNADPGDRLFVWGHDAPLYLASGLRPASRYIMTFPLTGYIFGSPLSHDPSHDTSDRILPGAWENLLEDFARHPPRFIYDNEVGRSPPKYPVSQFPILSRILDDEFELVQRTSQGDLYRRRD